MKKILILIIIVAVAALIWFSLSGDEVAAPEAPTEQETAGTTVEAELQGLGDENLDAEMMAIDADIKAL